METSRRFLVLGLTLLTASCVLKAKHDETLADNLKLSTRFSELDKNTKACQEKLKALEDKHAQTALRNEQLAKTNQLLVIKNKEIASETVETQKELLKAKSTAERAQEKIALLTKTYDNLVTELKDEIEKGQVQVHRLGDFLSVDVENQILFASGSPDIRKNGQTVLEKVASVLKKVKDKEIQVEGHTDNVKIRGSLREKFPTNWELSTTRATRVVRHLVTHGVDPDRVAAVGYGEYRPIATNDTAAGRKKNRRIEIVLIPPRDRD